MSVRWMTYLFCLIVAGGLSACVAQAAELPPSATPHEVDLAPTLPFPPQETPVPQDGTAPQEEKPIDMPSGAVIVFKRSGGLAGVDETWVIYPDGRIVGADGTAFQAPAEAVDDLLTNLEELNLKNLAGDYTPLNPCCDRFFYELSIDIKGLKLLIKTADGASGVPEAVWQALDLVSEFIAAYVA